MPGRTCCALAACPGSTAALCLASCGHSSSAVRASPPTRWSSQLCRKNPAEFVAVGAVARTSRRICLSIHLMLIQALAVPCHGVCSCMHLRAGEKDFLFRRRPAVFDRVPKTSLLCSFDEASVDTRTMAEATETFAFQARRAPLMRTSPSPHRQLTHFPHRASALVSASSARRLRSTRSVHTRHADKFLCLCARKRGRGVPVAVPGARASISVVLRLQRSRASSSQLLSLIINTFYSNKVCASRLGARGRRL
jgi:hypothetical protein